MKNKQWKKLSSQELFKSKFFSLEVAQCETLNGKVMPKYFTLDFPDWVQVLAFDSNENIILVEQYRYPGQGWFLELPGGSTHPDCNEEPLFAAKRELREETGYESSDWSFLGAHYPNPALMKNRCHVFLAKNCTVAGELQLDPFEEIEVVKMSIVEFEKKLLGAEKKHSLILATYLMFKVSAKSHDE